MQKLRILERAIKDFIQFFIYPRIDFRRSHPERLTHLLSLFIIVFFIEIIIAGILFNLIGFDTDQHKMTDLLDEFSKWQIFVLAVIIAPIIEEILFRYYITKPLIFILALPALLCGFALSYAGKGMMSWTICIFIAVLCISLLVLIVLNKSMRLSLTGLYLNYFPFMVYLSAVIFAFIHVFNFSGQISWYYAPILVFPQFVIGLFLAYVRVRNGLPYCILIHGVNNLIPMLAIMLVPESFLQG